MTLPGWDASYTPDEMAGLIEKIKQSVKKVCGQTLNTLSRRLCP